MDGDSRQGNAKGASARMEAPVWVHAYVWLSMVAIGASPALCVVLSHGSIARDTALDSLVLSAWIQGALWIAQWRCSSTELSYWDGLLVAAASMTTGVNLVSLLRSCCLLLVVVILSVLFALDHDRTRATRHAEIRFGKLIIWLHQQRLWSKAGS